MIKKRQHLPKYAKKSSIGVKYMVVHSGDTLVFSVDNMRKKWKISKVDNNTVKIYEEDGSYRQMPYTYLLEMFERGYIKIDAHSVVW
jgi:hypothetical protein